ncbi:hypothetical protein D3C71_78010 [compost metagenome]
MAYYAQIENGHVVKVVVVTEGTDTSGFPGKWVKTSYNTRGGVHYGADGQPDGGEAFRKNYACVGDVYDEQADAFYAPRPSETHVLDPVRFVWIDTHPVEAYKGPKRRDCSKYVYTPAHALSAPLRAVFEQIEARTPLRFTSDFTQAAASVLTTTKDLMSLLEDPLGRTISPVSWEVYQKLIEETPLEAFGLNVLTPQETMQIAYPLQVLTLGVVINRRSEALFWDTTKGERRCVGAQCSDRQKVAELPPSAETAVAAVAKGLQLPAGFHTVTLVTRDGYWYLLDWHPLLEKLWCEEAGSNPKLLEQALRHLVS